MSEAEVTENKVLEKAMSQGYNPDFDGDGKKTPEQFIADGEKIAGVQTKLNKELKEEIQGLKDDQKEFFAQQFKMNAESEKRGYDKKVKEIEVKQIEAVSEADTDLYKSLEKEKKDLKKPEPEQKKPAEQKTNPEFNDWAKDNKWYKHGSGDEASTLAEAFQGILYNENPNLKGKALYNEIKKRVAVVYPDINGKKAPNNLDFSDHSGNDGGSGDSLDPSSLDPEARKLFNMQVKSEKLTKEEQKNWMVQYRGIN